jgi:hypothetical protein
VLQLLPQELLLLLPVLLPQLLVLLLPLLLPELLQLQVLQKKFLLHHTQA